MPVRFDLYGEDGFKVLSPDNKILQRIVSYTTGFNVNSNIKTKIPMFYGTNNVTMHVYSNGANLPSNWYELSQKTGVYLVTGYDNSLYFIHKNGVAIESTAATKGYTVAYVGEYWDAVLSDTKYFYVKDLAGNIIWSFERVKQAPYIVAILNLTPNNLVTFSSPNGRRLHIMYTSIPGNVNVNTSNNTIFEWSGIAIKWSNNGKTITLGYMGETHKTALEDLERTNNNIRIIVIEFAAGD